MRSSKNSLFLMELVLSILFFALTGAVCLQLFVKAHTLSQDTINLNHAVTISQNYAEIFLACNGSLAEFPSYFGEQKDSQTIITDQTGNVSSFCLLYDEKWNPYPTAHDTSSSFCATISYTSDDTPSMRNARILVSDASGQEIYSLAISKYVGEEVAYEE